MRFVVLALAFCILMVSAANASPTDSPAAAKRVVRAWSAKLNAGDNNGIARLFSRPAAFVQGGAILQLETYRDIARWHSALPCAGRIASLSVKGDYVTAVFVLRNGKSRACDAPGQKAAAIFFIRGGKIRSWAQIPVPKQQGQVA